MLAKKLGKNLLVNRKKHILYKSATYRIILCITFVYIMCIPSRKVALT